MALALVVVLTAVVLAGCRGTAGTGPTSAPAGSASPEPAITVSLEVYGDSLTVADSPSLQTGVTGPQSWVHHLGAHGVRMAGGSGRWGATAHDILARHLQPDVQADLLVLFLGTNDLATAGPAGQARLADHHGQFVATLEQIADRQGYPDDQVVIVTVGPRDGGAAEPVEQWNRLTARAATDRGWHLADPWGELRTARNDFADPSLTTDGLHLDTAGAELLASGMVTELRRITGSHST